MYIKVKNLELINAELNKKLLHIDFKCTVEKDYITYVSEQTYDFSIVVYVNYSNINDYPLSVFRNSLINDIVNNKDIQVDFDEGELVRFHKEVIADCKTLDMLK
jgi:hypothetical protein